MDKDDINRNNNRNNPNYDPTQNNNNNNNNTTLTLGLASAAASWICPAYALPLLAGGHHMESTFHRFSELFAQLGLANDAASIAAFVRHHAPLPAGTLLHEAPFWTPAQAALLREELQEDADWAEVVDQLNAALRATVG